MITKERTPTNNELLHLNPATLAMVLFIDASDNFPASFPHQAAYIAIECKKLDNYSPNKLKDALRSSPEKISKLNKLAARRHKDNSNAPKNVNPSVMTGLMHGIIIYSFSLAYDLMYVPEPDLEQFLLSYIPKGGYNNTLMQHEAEGLVKKHRGPEFGRWGRIIYKHPSDQNT
ncbi:MAG TPA: hypothetical protein VM077_03870 [Candidatus Limnocylindrales bacterium]|nr:hypothetical protein [Candidatus Limnocylindrales bacterium]